MADAGVADIVNDEAETPVTTAVEVQRRELRFAPIMTGGTSLAVWIGGVTAELYDVVNREPDGADDDVYGAVLALTQTNAIVDIVTGTSAGGLNGVMLAVAWSHRTPTPAVRNLRDVWMQLGDIDTLLRDVSERNPRSLLRGDDYFWVELTKVLEHLAERGLAGSSLRDITWLTTVTTVTGERTREYDAIGQELSEARFGHVLTFQTNDMRDMPAAGNWAARLALAARSSASIPGVFEASFLPVADRPDRPGFGTRATFTKDRWALDGGVLDNKPIGIALDKIFDQTASSDIRRVLLYVNPTPELVLESPDDGLDRPPTIRTVLTATAGAPKNERIADDLRRIRERNAAVVRAADVRRTLGRLQADGRLDLVAGAASALPIFRDVRGNLSIDSMLARNAPGTIGSARQLDEIRAALCVAVRVWMEQVTVPTAVTASEPWVWGIAPLEYAAAMVSDLVGRLLRYPVDVIEVNDREVLNGVRAIAGNCAQALGAVRTLDDQHWQARLAMVRADTDLAEWATASYARWPADAPPDVDGSAMFEGAAAVSERVKSSLAIAAQNLAAAVQTLLGYLTSADWMTEDDAAVFTAHAALLEPDAPPSAASDDEVGRAARLDVQVARLIAVYTLAVTLGDTTRRPVRAEIVEVSYRAKNALDPDRSADDKIAGPEFSRLGAFVKPSWRANDWMWGRMDCAYQLLLVLLDPARLRQLGVTRTEAREALGLDPTPEIMAELAFLDDPASSTLPPPRSSLPKCAAALARRQQLRIARDELPRVHLAVLVSNEAGGSEGDAGAFRFAYSEAGPPASWTDDQVVELVQRCRIGAESERDELGHDPITRSGGQAIAVAANALTGGNSGIGLPGRIATPLRQVALVLYGVTRLVTTRSRTAVALTAAVFVVAAAIVGMQMLGTDLPTGVAFLAWTVLLVGVFLAILRSGLWSLLPTLLALLVVALALLGADLRPAITTTPGEDVKATIQRGDKLDVRGTIEFERRRRDDDSDRTRAPTAADAEIKVGRDRTGEVERGVVGVTRRTQDLTWKDTYFFGWVSVMSVLVLLAGFAWIGSIVVARRRARETGARKYQLDVALAAAGGPAAEPRMIRVPLLFRPCLLVAAVGIAQHWVYRWMLTGENAGVRQWIADVAESLGHHRVPVVLAGVTIVGVFLGFAGDRTVRPIFGAFTGWVDKFSMVSRGGLSIFLGAVAIAALAGVLAISHALADGGASYNEFQTAGAQLGTVIGEWSPHLRWAAAGAVALDLGFAVAYGTAGALGALWFAGRAQAGDRAGSAVRARLLTVAAFAVALGAAFDLLEGLGLWAALIVHAAKGSPAGIGQVVRVVGWCKWASVAFAGLAVLIALTSLMFTDRDERIPPTS